MAHALLLVGPVGSGKTTTLHEIETILDAQGVPNAIIDLDWLAWASPTRGSVHDLLVRNLADVWRNLRDAGVERIALARALDDAAEIAAVRAALDGCDTFVVDLAGDALELRERVRRRDAGVELEQHLALLDRWEATERGVCADAVVAIDGKTPRQVALDVLGAAGWPLHGA